MLRTERQSARMSKITNERLNPVWHRMFYSCTHMATAGVKGLIVVRRKISTHGVSVCRTVAEAVHEPVQL